MEFTEDVVELAGQGQHVVSVEALAHDRMITIISVFHPIHRKHVRRSMGTAVARVGRAPPLAA